MNGNETDKLLEDIFNNPSLTVTEKKEKMGAVCFRFIQEQAKKTWRPQNVKGYYSPYAIEQTLKQYWAAFGEGMRRRHIIDVLVAEGFNRNTLNLQISHHSCRAWSAKWDGGSKVYYPIGTTILKIVATAKAA